MKIKATVPFTAVVAVLWTAGPAAAQFDAWALGAKAGTLGVGGELTTRLLPGLNVRGSFQWLDLNFDADFEDIDYHADIEFSNPMALLDWYPFGGAFRISGGALFNGSDIALTSTPTEPVRIGNTFYSPDQIGTLRGESDFDDVAPYVGIGWGNPLSPDGHLSLNVDFGVAFIGSPRVHLSASGPIASNPIFQQQLAQEERDVEDDLDSFRYYPVLALSLTYRF